MTNEFNYELYVTTDKTEAEALRATLRITGVPSELGVRSASVSPTRDYYVVLVRTADFRDAGHHRDRFLARQAKLAELRAYAHGGPKPAWLDEAQRREREYVDNVVDL